MLIFKIKTKKYPAMKSDIAHITYLAVKNIGSVSGYLKVTVIPLFNRKIISLR